MTSIARTNTVFRKVGDKVQKVPVAIPSLGPTDVLLKITHSGLCQSDMHMINYGNALGHEGVGIVEEIGSAVTKFKVGDRAGGGYLRNSCGKCRYCLTGNEIWCYQRDIYGEANFNTGTFADYYVGSETYLHKIPDGMSSIDAAPLQCAGATVYDGMFDVVKAGDRVGIIGIGGLGHLAIQFANKLGAEVVVFSSTANKEAEARSFGASEFILLSEPEKVKAPIDVLVLTGSKYPDFSKFMVKEIFARQGTVIPLTVQVSGIMSLPALQMFFQGYNIKSSLVASRNGHDKMLNFAALHGIKPVTEVFKMDEDGWNGAMARMKSGAVRYRTVLVNE